MQRLHARGHSRWPPRGQTERHRTAQSASGSRAAPSDADHLRPDTKQMASTESSSCNVLAQCQIRADATLATTHLQQVDCDCNCKFKRNFTDMLLFLKIIQSVVPVRADVRTVRVVSACYNLLNAEVFMHFRQLLQQETKHVVPATCCFAHSFLQNRTTKHTTKCHKALFVSFG